jgi:uncharacterized membrane protein
MTIAALSLVLVSAALHATWNLWAKQIGGAGRATTLMWLLELISETAYAPVALFVALSTHWRPDAATLGWMATSALIHAAYFVLLLRGYRTSDLSVVYPVARGTGPLIAAAGAAVWLAERPTPLSVAGALFIAAGILILALRPDLRHAPHLKAGLIYGLLVGVTIGAYTLWDGAAVSRRGLPPILYYWGGEACRVLIFTPFALRDRAGVRALWRDHPARIVGISLLSPLSYILVLVAMSSGRVSHIAPTRELSVLIGAWLGARVLGEGDQLRRRVAAVAFAAGVVALAFA